MLGSKERVTLILFGPFEADLSTQELRKQGVRLRLPRQSFQILKMLLERPGVLVTREELRAALWPVDTFVDFEHGLNAAINRLREALMDEADNPVYVETLPRRGYRFIGAINNEKTSSPGLADSEPLNKEIATAKTAVIEAVTPEVRHKFRGLGAFAAVLVSLAIGATFVWLRMPQARPRVLTTTQLTRDSSRKLGLFTDGSRLYIAERRGLVQTVVTGGETSPIPIPLRSASVMDISPDHSQLLVRTQLLPENFFGGLSGEYWSFPLPSGPPHRIADLSGEPGRWSPDGRQLIFSRGKDVYLAKADGTDVRKLFTAPTSVSGYQFSLDGTRIRFHLGNWDDNIRSIWEVRTDGTNLHPLLPGWRNPASDCCGVWSPDGRYFLFVERDNNPSFIEGNIWALRETSSAFRKYPSRLFQLTTGPMLFRSLTWSPDGKKLFALGFQHRGELVRYDAQRRVFLPYLSGIWAADVSFSRDGQWVAYVTYPEGTLWRSRVDGSDRLQLTNPPAFAACVHWSPDGSQIAFVDLQGVKAGRPLKIWLISAQGGVGKEMLAENLNQVDPGWSPNSKQIVFGRAPTEKDGTIQLVDLNSKQVSIIPGSQGLFSPRWSPDGRYIAALTTAQTKIVVFDFEKQKWSDWASVPGAFLGYPSWSRDGQYLYFQTGITDKPGYYRVQLGQTRAELVVDFKDANLFFRHSTGGIWSGITPDGSPLFVRDTSTDEVYALDLELP